MTTASHRTSISLENFILESKNILTELDSYYETKKRSIDHGFQILFDNLPKEIKNISINKIYESYINCMNQKENLKNSADSEQTEEDDEFDEFPDETVNIGQPLDKESIKNLTSTVKKTNHLLKDPNFFPKSKFDSIINEQSIISEQGGIHNTNENDACHVGIYYFRKDGEQAKVKISQLKNIEMKDVHTNCVSDLTDLLKFYGLLTKTKIN